MFFKSLFPFLACLIAPAKINAVDPEKDENQVQVLIVNGMEAEIGRYDYFARSEDGNCGGFLITQDIVLTAAHCKKYFNGERVVIGSYNFLDQEGTGGPDYIEIKKIIRHPKWDPVTFDNDFLLLVLKNKSRFQPVIISETDDFLEPGDKVYAIGMGATSTDGPSSNPLLEVNLNYIENDECDKIYDSLDGYPITKSMLCTFTKFKDACQGDSGGPLIKRGVNAENDVIVGITSWGMLCADPEFPGVFARISTKYDWIKREVEKNGGKLGCENSDYSFFHGMKKNGEPRIRKCIWLAKTSKLKRKQICARNDYYVAGVDGGVSGPANTVCKDSCKSCLCYENKNSKYVTKNKNGQIIIKPCRIVSSMSPAAREKVCAQEHFNSANNVCPVSCEVGVC